MSPLFETKETLACRVSEIDHIDFAFDWSLSLASSNIIVQGRGGFFSSSLLLSFVSTVQYNIQYADNFGINITNNDIKYGQYGKRQQQLAQHR